MMWGSTSRFTGGINLAKVGDFIDIDEDIC